MAFQFTALGLDFLQRQASLSECIVAGVVALVGAISIFLASQAWKVLKPKQPQNNVGCLPLPPGSMGWPLLGETLAFIRGYSRTKTPWDPSFMQARRKLHGDIFKTRVMGLNAVSIGGPEGHKFIASIDGRLLEAKFFDTVTQQFGAHAVFLANGDLHKRLRRAMQEPFGLGSLKARLGLVESLTLDTLRSWEGKQVMVMKETTKFTFSLILGMVLSLKSGPQLNYLWEQFMVFAKGGTSLPINIPGTTFYKMLQARQALVKEFQKIIDLRRTCKTASEGGDILDSLLKPLNVSAGPHTMSDVELIDNIIFLLFAGYDTTAITLATIIRRLFQDPKEWSVLQDEHDCIREGLAGESQTRPLTWDAFRKMHYTNQMIYEAIRTSNIADILARRTLQDIEFQGYRIPKGWTVFIDRDSANFDTRTFKEPDKFIPARFEGGLPSNATWNPFGSGPHMCMGMELAKVEMGVFIHHLVTMYRWRILSDDFALDHGSLIPLYRSGLPTTFERRQ